MIGYIKDLKVLVAEGKNFRCKAEGIDYFRDEQNLLDLMKWSALLRIAKILQIFAEPKYKEFTLWEKINEKFQLDLVKMSISHSQFMTAMYFIDGVN